MCAKSLPHGLLMVSAANGWTGVTRPSSASYPPALPHYIHTGCSETESRRVHYQIPTTATAIGPHTAHCCTKIEWPVRRAGWVRMLLSATLSIHQRAMQLHPTLHHMRRSRHPSTVLCSGYTPPEHARLKVGWMFGWLAGLLDGEKHILTQQ